MDYFRGTFYLIMLGTWAIHAAYSLIKLVRRQEIRLGWIGRRIGNALYSPLEFILFGLIWVGYKTNSAALSAVAIVGFFLISADNLLNSKNQSLDD